MKAVMSVENKIEELLLCLDRDARHIEQTLSRLNELRSLIVKRDEASLGKLLEKIQADSEDYTKNEAQRKSIRQELASAMNCDIRQITLSNLVNVVAQEKKNQLVERKTKLRTLTEQLKKELTCTTFLLSDCARFNRLLLKSIIGSSGTETIFYSSNGSAGRKADMALVNLKF